LRERTTCPVRVAVRAGTAGDVPLSAPVGIHDVECSKNGSRESVTIVRTPARNRRSAQASLLSARLRQPESAG
jgi:hypothetical protein